MPSAPDILRSRLWLPDWQWFAQYECDPYALTVGTASGPVRVVTPPQNRNVPAGANGSFSVIASGASPLGYQWQHDNVDIPGASSPTYVTPVLTLGDSGAQFRVRVSNAFGFALARLPRSP